MAARHMKRRTSAVTRPSSASSAVAAPASAPRRGVLEPVVVAIVSDRGGQPGLELEQALPVALGDLLGGPGSYPSGTSSSPGWVNAEAPAPANVIASR